MATATASGAAATSTVATPSTFKYYEYSPIKTGALVFAILFFVVSLIHLIKLFRHRAWFFFPIIIGGVLECIGYVARTKGPYIVQALAILVAPALMAATIYMILGRIVLATDGEAFSLTRKKWLTKIFVCGDVLSFLVLAGGSALLTSKTESLLKLAPHLILVGLFIQIVFFGLFIVVSFLFHTRIHRDPTPTSLSSNLPWQQALSHPSLLIMVRSVVRVVEYIQGTDGYILSHEVFLYVFDATLMFIAIAIFVFWHPSPMLGLDKREKKWDTERHLLGSMAKP
ncbi:putative RTA1 domain protein [Hyaloscypha variabilis]